MWSCAQPGVDDPEITQLVEEKVDAFWKGVEGDANKRGQVRPNPVYALIFTVSRRDFSFVDPLLNLRSSIYPCSASNWVCVLALLWLEWQILVTFSEKRQKRNWFLTGEVRLSCICDAEFYLRLRRIGIRVGDLSIQFYDTASRAFLHALCSSSVRCCDCGMVKP